MNYPAELDGLRNAAETILKAQFVKVAGPPMLIEAMGYSLFAGGKRVRPVLLLAAHRIFGSDTDPAPAAAAIEFIHTYSLIHDDLPAMDNDDFRRGRPTCHKKFGEAMAILAGDALLTEAFNLMATAYAGLPGGIAARVISELAAAAGSDGMVGGQVLDIDATGKTLDQAGLEAVHRRKTGALISAAVRIGALLGGATGSELTLLTSYAANIGLAFQVADDVLDVTSTREELGKSIGKDSSQGKTTYVTIMGVERSREYARRLSASARECLAPLGGRASALRSMAEFIAARTA